MSSFDILYRREALRGEKTAYFFRWVMILFLGGMAALQILDPVQKDAGIAASFIIGMAVVYNGVITFFIQRDSHPRALAWISASIDVLLITGSIMTTTLFLHPSGASVTAIVLIYPVVIFLAALRHNRLLIIYTTLLSVLCFNAVYWSTRGAIPPELYIYAPLVNASGQFFKSMYILFFGLVVQISPKTTDRLLRSQQTAFDLAQEKYAKMSESLKGDFDSLKIKGSSLLNEIRSVSADLRDITEMTARSTETVASQAPVVDLVSSLIRSLNHFSDSMEHLVTEQSVSIEETASATEEMLGNIDSITRHLFATRGVVEELLAVSDKGRCNLDSVLKAVESIAQKSLKMLDAVTIISGIAGTTNLLAMNAAIEAAHAGDAGRGFSVVADEIRKLAEQTATQSRDIQVDLEDVKTSIDDAVSSSGDANSSFTKVLDKVKTLARHMDEIEQAMKEQAAGSGEISTTLAVMKDATVKVRDGAEELRKQSGVLSENMESLVAANHRISAHVQGVSVKTGAIDEASKTVLTLMEENEKLVDHIYEEVLRFRVIDD